MSNYVTKSDLKKVAGVDTSDFAKRVGKIDIGKLKTTPVDLIS